MLSRYKLIRIITYALFYFVLININGCSKESSKLKQIKSNGILRIALVADPPHYYYSLVWLGGRRLILPLLELQKLG